MEEINESLKNVAKIKQILKAVMLTDTAGLEDSLKIVFELVEETEDILSNIK